MSPKSAMELTGTGYGRSMAHSFTLIGVPIDSAGTAGGTELAPAALRDLGLGAIADSDRGDLQVRIRAGGRDPITGVVGLDDVCATTMGIRSAVSDTLSRGEVPFLIGGCCAMVPGALAGVRDSGGRASLVHLDGHLDLYDEVSSPLGEAADMPVAIALGRGPARWIDAAGGPSVQSSDTWIIGYRDREPSELDGSLMPEDLNPPVNTLSTEEVRRLGAAQTGQRAARALESPAPWMWVHLDLDIVDPTLFFANDAPVLDGLDWEQVTDLLRPLCSSPALAGFSLGCYNPEKDREEHNGHRIVEMFRAALSP
jgi:arginase